MSHFAKVQNGIVVEVIVAENDAINSGDFGPAEEWIQTSYNTHGGLHYGPDGNPDNGLALRANYAGVGFIYDAANDVFYMQQPFPSWKISAPDWIWKPPLSYPIDGQKYRWDEETLSWVVFIPPPNVT